MLLGFAAAAPIVLGFTNAACHQPKWRHQRWRAIFEGATANK
jgi:hypothetical protein